MRQNSEPGLYTFAKCAASWVTGVIVTERGWAAAAMEQ